LGHVRYVALPLPPVGGKVASSISIRRSLGDNSLMTRSASLLVPVPVRPTSAIRQPKQPQHAAGKGMVCSKHRPADVQLLNQRQ